MSDDSASLLTARQRKYLRDKIEPSNESQMKRRIRERVYSGFRNDSSILLDKLPTEERRKIFREWENQRYDSIPDEIDFEPGKDPFEKSTITISLSHLLGFLYLGIDESNLRDFEDLLESGIDHAMRERGMHVESLDLNIEFGELATVNDLYEMIESGQLDPLDLTIRELESLYEHGFVDEDWLRDTIDFEGETLFGATKDEIIEDITTVDSD